jgi:NhaP-type Na+/H+ or K+/H+ antiporter
MKVGLSDLRRAWRLPGRALLLGLPLTLLVTALLAHYIAGLPWLQCFLLGAVLAPTDPVFAAAIVVVRKSRGAYAISSPSSQDSTTVWPCP